MGHEELGDGAQLRVGKAWNAGDREVLSGPWVARLRAWRAKRAEKIFFIWAKKSPVCLIKAGPGG